MMCSRLVEGLNDLSSKMKFLYVGRDDFSNHVFSEDELTNIDKTASPIVMCYNYVPVSPSSYGRFYAYVKIRNFNFSDFLSLIRYHQLPNILPILIFYEDSPNIIYSASSFSYNAIDFNLEYQMCLVSNDETDLSHVVAFIDHLSTQPL